MKKFEQLKSQVKQIESLIPVDHRDAGEISAVTSDFDRAFELAWKTLKEYLEKERMMIEARTGSPKDIIKLAYRENLINDEEEWINMLVDRNDDTHKYDRIAAHLFAARIEERYIPVLRDMISSMSQWIEPEEYRVSDIPEGFYAYAEENGYSILQALEHLKVETGCVSPEELFACWEDISIKLQAGRSA